jgi:hypothetical protein
LHADPVKRGDLFNLERMTLAPWRGHVPPTTSFKTPGEGGEAFNRAKSRRGRTPWRGDTSNVESLASGPVEGAETANTLDNRTRKAP